MKKYAVSIPVAGYIYVEVDADSEEDAKEKVFDMEFSSYDIEEWDLHEAIVEGNVFHGILNSIAVQEVDD